MRYPKKNNTHSNSFFFFLQTYAYIYIVAIFKGCMKGNGDILEVGEVKSEKLKKS
jgi:hypothetical protein